MRLARLIVLLGIGAVLVGLVIGSLVMVAIGVALVVIAIIPA